MTNGRTLQSMNTKHIVLIVLATVAALLLLAGIKAVRTDRYA